MVKGRKKSFIDLGGPIDLGFKINTPKISSRESITTRRSSRKTNKGTAIQKIKPIDLGFGMKLPKVSTPKPSRNIDTGPMPQTFTGFGSFQGVKAGGAFDTGSSFKGMLATSKGGSQEIKISKEDIEKIRAGFKRFSQGGENIGRRLRGSGAKKGSSTKTKPVKQEFEVEKSITGKILPKGTLAKPTIKERAKERERVASLPPAQRILQNLRSRFGLN